jgi:hypothetical protein
MKAVFMEKRISRVFQPFIFLCTLMMASQAVSQDFTFSGLVKDQTTGETLLGASIYTKNLNKGTITNEYGFFSLSLPKGNHSITISYLGYKEETFSITLIENLRKDIELQPSEQVLTEIVITSNQNRNKQTRKTLSGTINIKPKDIKKLPSLLGEPDITRVMLTQSGVASVGEGTSGFNVRGGNIDQNLILLDEAPIYNSSHIWGFFSIFNTDAVKDMQLYKGGIPARYGGRASSVLDIRQREGSNKTFKGEGGIGLLFSRLTLEGPIKKEKLNFLISGRRSYFDLAFPLFESLKNNKVYFYDLNSKLSWNINKNNRLYASGYFGADVMKLKLEDESNIEEDERVDFQWKNATATLRWNHIFSDKLFMNLSGIYSRYNYGLSSENSTGGPVESVSDDFRWTSSVENWIVKPDFTLYQNADTKIRFGTNQTLYRFKSAEITSTDNDINPIDFEPEKGLEIAPYLSYDRHWDKWSVNFGLRYSWFANLGSQTVTLYQSGLPKTSDTATGTKTFGSGEIVKRYGGLEPRLAVKYDLSDRKAFKLGYNRMFQYIHLISNTNATLPFDIWKPSGFHIKPLEVNQMSLGYAYDTPNNSYNVSVEGYYKTFRNMLEYKNGANLFLNETLETELLPAEGYSYGLEFGLQKTKGRLTGNTNYTYSVTKRRTTSPITEENINYGD